MWRYLGRRLLVSVVTVAGIVVVVFFIMRVLPGDAAAVRAGPYASEEKLEQIREQLGLSDPVPVQFVNYVRDVISGDLATVPPASCTLWRKRVPALLEVRGLRKTFGRGRGALPAVRGGGGGGGSGCGARRDRGSRGRIRLR